LKTKAGKMENIFEIGDSVSVGNDSKHGRIVNKYKPFGTFTMYTVHLFHDGTFVTAAKHELVKGMDDNEFNHLPPRNLVPSSTSTQLISLPITNTTSTSVPSVSLTVTPPPPTQNDTEKVLELNSEPIPDDVAYILSQLIQDDPDMEVNEPVSLVNTSVPVVNPQNSMFKPFSNTDIDQFIHEHENESTQRKTQGHVKLLTQFLNEQGYTRIMSCIPPTDLNDILCKFFVGVRQKNGEEYEPSYLRGMLGSFERHLKKLNYNTSLIFGYEFSKAREVLKCKQKNLKMQGKGNLPKRADAISDDEISKLFEKGCLGPSTPKSLVNTMWYNNTLHFGMRGGGEEHRTLKWGDITLQLDEELNTEYLEYNERQTKTRTGEDTRNIRDSKPRMYAVPHSPTCPVMMYKAYKAKRPENFNDPGKPFYLATVTHTTNPREDEQWFLRGPLGRNKLNNLMKEMVTDGDLPNKNTKRLTNTSVRKHLCQTLLDNNIPDGQAIHITGHKNPASLNNYR